MQLEEVMLNSASMYDPFHGHETIASLCSKFIAALFTDGELGPLTPKPGAFEDVFSVELETLGLGLLINKDNADSNLSVVSTLTADEKQSLIDELYKAVSTHKLGSVLMSKFLGRIWLSTHLIPSQLRLEGITNVSLHPFTVTASSDVKEGTMAGGTLVALKTFRRTKTQPPSEEDVTRFFFEAMVSLTTRHRNIIPMLGIHVGMADDIYLVSKLQTHGSLLEYLSAHPEADRFLILEKLADAVVYLHDLPTPILHGDIRGLNILMDGEGEPLLIDFGFSLVLDPLTQTFLPITHHFIGNPRWTPHEKLHETEFPLTLKADSFSFASLILEVLSDDVPYTYLRNNSAVIIEVIMRDRAPRRPDIKLLTDPLWELMEKCWSRNPHDRPSMENVRHGLASIRSALTAAPLL